MIPVSDSLETMGFHTMTDDRCRVTSITSRLARCVLVVTERCNFACPYCRSHEGRHMPTDRAKATIRQWAGDELYAILFTGGEPTVHPDIVPLVRYAASLGVPHIGVATNGSATLSLYRELVDAGVNEFNISLDTDNAADSAVLTGRSPSVWTDVVANIRALSRMARVTIGFVIDEHNVSRAEPIIRFAMGLGVADIRLNPAAQFSALLPPIELDPESVAGYPNLSWRLRNGRRGVGVRGLGAGDAGRCWLVQDEMTVSGEWHYPCFIYMREGGRPIGRFGPGVRQSRLEWLTSHSPQDDPICRANCADCCSAFNRRYEELQGADRG